MPMISRNLSSVCVFCGASMGKHPVYEESARTLGTELAERRLTLVYGGGSIGLMGAIARAADAGGAPIVSIIPKSLEQVESVGQSFGEVIVIDSLAERKELMGQRSDAFIAMPGGFGTLDELIEMITWSQLGVHAKPVGLLNVNGFYDPFMAMIEHHLAEGFIQERHRQLFVADEKPDVLLDKLAAQVIPESLIQW